MMQIYIHVTKMCMAFTIFSLYAPHDAAAKRSRSRWPTEAAHKRKERLTMMFGLENLPLVAATVIGIAAAAQMRTPPDKDIVVTAAAAGQFKTLAAALTAAGLVDTLKGLARSRSSPPPTSVCQLCLRARSTPSEA